MDFDVLTTNTSPLDPVFMSVGSDFHSPRSESADRQKVRSAF